MYRGSQTYQILAYPRCSSMVREPKVGNSNLPCPAMGANQQTATCPRIFPSCDSPYPNSGPNCDSNSGPNCDPNSGPDRDPQLRSRPRPQLRSRPRPQLRSRPRPQLRSRTATPTPVPSLARLHNTRNTRWLERNYLALSQQIMNFPWVQDGLSDSERNNIDNLLYIGVGHISNLEQTLDLRWMQDDITETEHDAIYQLRRLNYDNKMETAVILTMPFMASLEPDDVLAIRGMYSLANDGLLSPLMDHPAFTSGITDAQTTLVIAIGTLGDLEEINRMLSPGYAVTENVLMGTDLTPHLGDQHCSHRNPVSTWNNRVRF